MELCQERRGEHTGMHYLSSERVQLHYDLPLVGDRARLLRPAQVAHPRVRVARLRAARACAPSNLVKLDVLLGGDPVDALSMVVHRDKAYEFGKTLTEKLRKKIPRQQYDVPIQAAVGAKIIARETVKAFRKDVTAKCYGGDISRKRKLLERQKEGKKRMKQVGRIEVPAGRVPRRARARGRRVMSAVGKTYAPVTYAVGREKVREYAHAVGETNPLYLDLEAARAAGHRDVVAPPMFAVVYASPAVPPAFFDPEVGMDFARMVHGAPGVHLGPAGRRRRRDHHRGRGRRAVTERGGDGLLRLRVALGQPGRRARLHRPLDLHREGGVSRGECPELRVTPDRYLTVRYAGASGDFNPIHIDEEFARVGRAAGPDPARAVVDGAGRAGADRGGRRAGARSSGLSVQFRGMGVPEQEVVVTSTVREVADGVATVDAEARQGDTRLVRRGEAEVAPLLDFDGCSPPARSCCSPR